MKNFSSVAMLAGCVVGVWGVSAHDVMARAMQPAAAAQPETKPEVASVASGKIDLRPRFTKGQEIRFRMKMESTGTQAGGLGDAGEGPGEQSMSTNQEIGLLMRVKDVNPETGAMLDLVYESLKFNMDSPMMGRVEFDSSKPATGGDAAMAEMMLRPMVGLTLSVKTDKDGNITEVKTPDGVGGVGGEMLRQFTGADVVKNMFGPIVSLRRGTGQAAVGEMWTNQDAIESPMGTMKVTTNNTLSSHSGGRATIDINGGVSLTQGAGGASAIPGLVPKATIKESSIKGQAIWDTGKGMLRSVKSEQNITIEADIGGQKTVSKQVMKMDVARVGE